MTITDAPQTTELEPPAGEGRARWSRLASAGAAATASAPLVMLAAAVVWGMDVGEDIGFFLGVAIVALAGAALLRSRRTAARIAGVVISLLAGGSVFWTAFGLAAPDSVFDFVPGLLAIPGALVAVVAGVAAVRAQRRGDLLTTAGAGERKVMLIAATALVVLTGLSTVLTVTGRSSVDGDLADAVVELKDFEFDAAEAGYAFSPGEVVLVRNDDPFLHTFTVEELGIDIDLGPGDEALVTIPADASGGYVLYCEPHTSKPEDPAADDMATTLTVR